MVRREETDHEAEVTIRGRIRGLTLPGIRKKALQADWGRARGGSGGQQDGLLSKGGRSFPEGGSSHPRAVSRNVGIRVGRKE